MAYELLERLKLEGRLPQHVAVIMDGNGRWARARGLPRYRGHSAGMSAVREVIEGSVEAGVRILTLFAFSTENWNRPEREVGALMRLLQAYVKREAAELKRQGVEVHVHGDLDRLAAGPRRGVDEIERVTAGGDRLHLNLLISYSGRAELARAARRLAERVRAGELDPEQIDENAMAGELYTAGMPEPDLLIRTSGEQRISNFMLWQLAYTELYITPTLWPDFTRRDLFEAILEYQRRDRRFGRVTAS
ncbi:MAG TPA: polyprenyl diphosphate synthase [Longimicrobiales bacterium]|nr:polyprenyl diphosphate synthase [Longimicrobiales bacterium]